MLDEAGVAATPGLDFDAGRAATTSASPSPARTPIASSGAAPQGLAALKRETGRARHPPRSFSSVADDHSPVRAALVRDHQPARFGRSGSDGGVSTTATGSGTGFGAGAGSSSEGARPAAPSPPALPGRPARQLSVAAGDTASDTAAALTGSSPPRNADGASAAPSSPSTEATGRSSMDGSSPLWWAWS